jgi:hypothetical protein
VGYFVIGDLIPKSDRKGTDSEDSEDRIDLFTAPRSARTDMRGVKPGAESVTPTSLSVCHEVFLVIFACSIFLARSSTFRLVVDKPDPARLMKN